MNQERTIIFEQFAQRAKQRIEERKKINKEELEIDSMGGMSIDIRGVSDTELSEIYEFSQDPIEVDQYLIFYASATLQEAAKYMAQDGSLKTGKEYKITEIFTSAERSFIAKRILTLSGVYDEAGIRVKESETVKNS